MPLILALLLGFGRVLQYPHVQTVIGLVGGAFLLWMGVDLLRSLRTAEIGARDDPRSPVLVGALLSAGNPYFLIWWAAVGMTLITQSRAFGLTGFTLFAVAHWLCDAVWLTFLSQLAHRGGRFFGKRFQQGGFLLCGAALLIFGATREQMISVISRLMGGDPGRWVNSIRHTIITRVSNLGSCARE
jgi:threonine/homoserine/homoserine lactone efflux protein